MKTKFLTSLRSIVAALRRFFADHLLKTRCLTTPESIFAALRQYFVDHNLDTFERYGDNFLRIHTRIDDTDVSLHVEVRPFAFCVRIKTTLLSTAKVSLSSCQHVANSINALAPFVRITIDETSRRFEIENWRFLGAGQCLAGQLSALAASHMAGLAQFAPTIAHFASGKLTLVEVQDRLELMGAIKGPESDVDDPPSSRAKPADTILPPRWRN